MKKYEIQLCKKLGSNTFQFVKINSFETRDEWQKALRSLMDALLVCNCSSKVDYSKVEEQHIAFLNIEAQ